MSINPRTSGGNTLYPEGIVASQQVATWSQYQASSDVNLAGNTIQNVSVIEVNDISGLDSADIVPLIENATITNLSITNLTSVNSGAIADLVSFDVLVENDLSVNGVLRSHQLDTLSGRVDTLSGYVDGLTSGATSLADAIALDNDASGLSIVNLGNVGVGTTTPGNQLHIVKSSNYPEIATEYESGAKLILGSGSIGTYIGYSGYLTMGTITGLQLTGYTDLFRFTSTGRLGIGTGSPATQLQLTLDSASKPTTSTWTITSDARLKEDIVEADTQRCYDIVKSLKLKHYRWKDEFYTEKHTNDKSKLGWIADEVETYFPKAVEIVPEWIYQEEVKDASSGNIIQEEKKIENLKTLNTDQLYAVMYGTIQQLIKQNEELYLKIEKLTKLVI